MSKQCKIVSISVAAHAKRRLENASKAVAALASASVIVSDDTFGPRSRRR
jgi:hypothetical protein